MPHEKTSAHEFVGLCKTIVSTAQRFIAVDIFGGKGIMVISSFERNDSMVSTVCYDYLCDNIVRFDLCGLSSDSKPSPNFLKRIIANGSSFIEMDTGMMYLFDFESATWVKFGGTD